MIVQAPEMSQASVKRKYRKKPLHDTNANKLFDCIKAQYKLSSDSALADMLDVTPQIICRVRSGDMKLSASLVLAVYDATEMSIEHIRELLN